MSAVKDKFYELFAPKMAAHGFTFKKSVNNFIKTNDNIQCVVHIRWDGRGGTSIIDGIDYYVIEPTIEKAFNKLIGGNGLGGHQINSIPLHDANRGLIIPVMYTQAVLDLANNMNFKALAQIPFEEKYPLIRIQNCVNKVEQLLINNAFPFLEQYDTELKTYEGLCKKLNELEKLEDSFPYFILLIKMYAQKLGLPEPERLNGYTFYIEQFKEHFSSYATVDFDTLEMRLAQYNFNQNK